jgi:uncharacterized membrane protein
MGFLSSLIPGFIKDALGMVNDHFEHKRKIKRAQVDNVIAVEQAKVKHVITMAEKSQSAEIDWDIQAMKNSESSWKDEFWTVVLALPLILMFVPAMAPIMVAGFEALDAAPDYYKAAVGVAIAAAFGVRKLAERFGK